MRRSYRNWELEISVKHTHTLACSHRQTCPHAQTHTPLHSFPHIDLPKYPPTSMSNIEIIAQLTTPALLKHKLPLKQTYTDTHTHTGAKHTHTHSHTQTHTHTHVTY